MNRGWMRGLLISGLLVGLAPAQRNVSVYGGVFQGDQPVRVDVDAPAGTAFTLRRVLDPAALFAASPDPHLPALRASPQSPPLRTLRLARGAGRLDFGRLPSGVYTVGTGGLAAVVLVSNLGLVVKRDQTQALTYTADRDSGQTRAARVWALGSGHTPLLAGTDGVARFVRAAPAGATRRPSWPASATTGPSRARTGTATPRRWCAATSTPTGRSTGPDSTWTSRRC